MTHHHDLPGDPDPRRTSGLSHDRDVTRDRAGLGRDDLNRDVDRDRAGVAGDQAGSVVLHEEQLRVRTERIPSGRVRFRKRIVTEERTMVVQVRREELEIIEDHDVDTPAGAAGDARDDRVGGSDHPRLTGERLGGAAGAGPRGGDESEELRLTPEGDYEILLHAEEPVVTIETRPVERVRISRRAVTDTQQFSAQIEREEAVVDREDARDIDGDGRRGEGGHGLFDRR